MCKMSSVDIKMNNFLKGYYATRLGVDDAGTRDLNFFPADRLPNFMIYPMGEMCVRDSRVGTDDTTMDYLHVWGCIVNGEYDDATATDQLDNFDFRQFCRNWDASEVQPLIQRRQESNSNANHFSPSKNEKLIGAYFVCELNSITHVNKREAYRRMKQLMNYRTDDFVVKLFNTLYSAGGDDHEGWYEFYKQDELMVANHTAMTLVEDWEVKLILADQDNSDGEGGSQV